MPQNRGDNVGTTFGGIASLEFGWVETAKILCDFGHKKNISETEQAGR